MENTWGISPFGLGFLKQQEGYRPKAYGDFKQYSIGFGTRANSPDETIDTAEAERRLLDETGKVSDWLRSNVRTPLDQSKADALISAGYNLGTGKGGLSDFLGDINTNNWQGVADRLRRYNHAGGQVNDALTRRRAQEASMILNGSPAQGQSMASMTGGFGIPANFDPNDPTSAMFAPPPAGIGGAQTPLPNPGGPVPINLPQPPNMRYSKLADALLGSAAGAQPTGWGSLLNALGDAGLGYTMANKADTRQREYQSALAQALGSAKTPEDITAAMIASGNPEMMNQGVAARMATLSPKAKKDRFLVTPNGVFDLETSQMVQGTSKEQPDDTITVNGRVLHRDASGKYSEVYNVPPQLQATDRKEIFESDAAAQAGNSAIITLKKALDLNKKAYSGPAAQTRGYVSSLFGTEGGQATEDLNNLVTAQALDQLKATFGAAPTEGERKILLDIQGSTSQAPTVREKIWKRAIDMAQRRVDFNKEQAKGLRSGTYFQPGYSPVTPNQSPQPDQPANQPQQRYKFNPETGELE